MDVGLALLGLLLRHFLKALVLASKQSGHSELRIYHLFHPHHMAG